MNRTPVGGARTFDRRTAFRLAAIGVPMLAGALSAPGLASAAPRPTGTGYARYEDLYRSGDSLQAVVNKVRDNKILTLPEGTFTFRDFTQGYYDGIRIGTGSAAGCRGLVGSGRGTVVRGVANTASRSRSGGFAGNQITVGNKPGAVISNFSLKGSSQNGLYYCGLVVNNCSDAVVSDMYLRGGSRGYAQRPPGETFGINVFNSARVTIKDTEIDGRDDAGNRVGASPIGWNGGTDARIYRTYTHHGVAGMLTFFETQGIYTEDYRTYSTSSGSGTLTGSGINHEQSAGRIQHVRPQLFVNGKYTSNADSTASTGAHLSFANTYTDLTDVTVTEPTWDRNIGSTGMLMLSIRDGYTVAGATQKVKTPPRIVKNGAVLKRSDHPAAGWASKNPGAYFGWIH